jgi:hypothetical protein
MDRATLLLLIVPPLFVSGIVAVLLLVGRSMTKRLVEQYPAREPFLGTTWTLPYARLGGVKYSYLIRVGANAGGLYLKVPGQAPVLVPWREVKVTVNEGVFGDAVILTTRRAPAYALGISDGTAKRLRDLSQGEWPLDRKPTPEDAADAAAELRALGSPWSKDN